MKKCGRVRSQQRPVNGLRGVRSAGGDGAAGGIVDERCPPSLVLTLKSKEREEPTGFYHQQWFHPVRETPEPGFEPAFAEPAGRELDRISEFAQHHSQRTSRAAPDRGEQEVPQGALLLQLEVMA